jgi:hypothetical protein
MIKTETDLLAVLRDMSSQLLKQADGGTAVKAFERGGKVWRARMPPAAFSWFIACLIPPACSSGVALPATGLLAP